MHCPHAPGNGHKMFQYSSFDGGGEKVAAMPNFVVHGNNKKGCIGCTPRKHPAKRSLDAGQFLAVSENGLHRRLICRFGIDAQQRFGP